MQLIHFKTARMSKLILVRSKVHSLYARIISDLPQD